MYLDLWIQIPMVTSYCMYAHCSILLCLIGQGLYVYILIICIHVLLSDYMVDAYRRCSKCFLKTVMTSSISFIQVEDPLSEALKYLRLLQEHSADALETHLLAFEVYFRKGKKLLALQVR